MIRAAPLTLLIVLTGCSSTPEPAIQPYTITRDDHPDPPPPTPVSGSAAPTAELTPQPAPVPPEPPKELFPDVFLDLAARTVEVTGVIARDGGNPPESRDALVTYLEVLVCRPNSREHETIVVSKALPSHVHAALLLAGLAPGSPASWSWDDTAKVLTPIPPKGDAVTVTLLWNEAGTPREKPLAEMVVHVKTGEILASRPAGFLFAGSGFMKRAGQERYAADLGGTLVGLHTFGDEPIAWSENFSPTEAVEEPAWVIRSGHVPPADTPVRVRIKPR
jgi:hypothetical protein